MIVIDLSCATGHAFEAWFPSAEAFSRQNEAGQVHCPQCSCTDIRRIPSAAYIAKNASPEPRGQRAKDKSQAQSSPPKTPQGISALKFAIDALLATSEDVGHNFAQEARRIHYQEVPPRSVHGQATALELQSLTEEGIDVLPIPKLTGEDLN